LNSPKVRSANDSFEESEKIHFNKEILKSIEKNIGYEKQALLQLQQDKMYQKILRMLRQ